MRKGYLSGKLRLPVAMSEKKMGLYLSHVVCEISSSLRESEDRRRKEG